MLRAGGCLPERGVRVRVVRFDPHHSRRGLVDLGDDQAELVEDVLDRAHPSVLAYVCAPRTASRNRTTILSASSFAWRSLPNAPTTLTCRLSCVVCCAPRSASSTVSITLAMRPSAASTSRTPAPICAFTCPTSTAPSP